jgi:uncharacterized OB-fold protein
MELSETTEVELTNSRQRLDAESGTLIGSECPSCGASSWPARAICHRCGHAMLLGVEFPREGTLLSYTKVWVERPGLPTPYVLGQIQIADAIFFAHVRELPVDAKVPLIVRVTVPATATDSVDFWFEPDPSTVG